MSDNNVIVLNAAQTQQERKGTGRSMLRRLGQSSSVRLVGKKWYGRYWRDVPGEEKRKQPLVVLGHKASIDEAGSTAQADGNHRSRRHQKASASRKSLEARRDFQQYCGCLGAEAFANASPKFADHHGRPFTEACAALLRQQVDRRDSHRHRERLDSWTHCETSGTQDDS